MLSSLVFSVCAAGDLNDYPLDHSKPIVQICSKLGTHQRYDRFNFNEEGTVGDLVLEFKKYAGLADDINLIMQYGNMPLQNDIKLKPLELERIIHLYAIVKKEIAYQGNSFV